MLSARLALTVSSPPVTISYGPASLTVPSQILGVNSDIVIEPVEPDERPEIDPSVSLELAVELMTRERLRLVGIPCPDPELPKKCLGILKILSKTGHCSLFAELLKTLTKQTTTIQELETLGDMNFGPITGWMIMASDPRVVFGPFTKRESKQFLINKILSDATLECLVLRSFNDVNSVSKYRNCGYGSDLLADRILEIDRTHHVLREKIKFFKKQIKYHQKLKVYGVIPGFEYVTELENVGWDTWHIAGFFEHPVYVKDNETVIQFISVNWNKIETETAGVKRIVVVDLSPTAASPIRTEYS